MIVAFYPNAVFLLVPILWQQQGPMQLLQLHSNGGWRVRIMPQLFGNRPAQEWTPFASLNRPPDLIVTPGSLKPRRLLAAKHLRAAWPNALFVLAEWFPLLMHLPCVGTWRLN